MKKYLLALSFVSSVGFAQDSKETVTVTGSKIWPPAGPITTVGLPEGPHPCAEPNCGEKTEPGEGGGGATTQADKNKTNKDSKEKAKKVMGDIKEMMKGTMDIIKALKKWLTGDAWIHWDNVEVTVHPDGSKTYKGGCFDAHVDMGDPSNKDLPCVDIKGEPEPVKKANGTIENQLRVTYRVVYPCFYTNQCGVTYLSFIAGSPDELAALLNDSIGEKYF